MTTTVENERTKLIANALDRASTASLAVGVFTPIAGLTYGTMEVSSNAGPLFLYLAVLFWLFAALILHVPALRVLRRLK